MTLMRLGTSGRSRAKASTPARKTPRSVGHRAGSVLLVVGAVIFLLPFIFTLATAIRPAADVADHPLGFPTHLALTNFTVAFKQIHYLRSVFNTLLIMSLSCALITVIGATASYPLGRITAHWSTWAYRVFILGTTVPVFVVIAPLYLLMRDLHLLNSTIGVVLIYTAINLPVAVFFYTSFVRQVPAELEEAAAIDGCGVFRTYFTIVFPLLRPITGTLLTFISLAIWNDLVIPLVFLSDPNKRTVMVNAYSFFNPHLVEPTQLFPAALLGIVPLFALFLFFQRQVIEGIAAGAVKS